MRRLLFCMSLCFLLLVPSLALAGAADMPTEFFSWESIGTFSGAVALVVFLVQLLKLPMDRVRRIPTQYIVYVVSLGVLLLAQAFVPALGGLTWQSGILCVFNAALVALSAMSLYNVAIDRVETRKLLQENTGICISGFAASDAQEAADKLIQAAEQQKAGK